MHKYKNILFDIDGTLVDSKPGIMAILKYVFQLNGIPYGDDEWFNQFVGPPIEKKLIELFGIKGEKLKKIVEEFRKNYLERGIYICSEFPGVKELLVKLKDQGFMIYVASSKTQVHAEVILSYLGLHKYVDSIVGGLPNLLEKADVLRRLLATYGVDKEECILVGDTRYDVLGAKEVGMDVMAVTYGYGIKEEFERFGANYCVDTVEQIGDLLINK